MDVFKGWENHTERIKANWNHLVTDNDTVVLPGDFSWGLKLQETIDYKDTEYSVTSIREYAFNHCENLAFNEYGNCRYLGTDGNPYFALIQTTNTTLSSYTIYNQTKIISCSAFSSC